MKRKLRIAAAAAILAGSVIAITAASVSANGGPHEGTFSVTSDACAGCHRLHTGQTGQLLKADSQINLCYSCHAGVGSNVDVKDGIYLGSANGTTNAGLRGGGFETALLNLDLATTFNQTGTPAAVTSRHSVSATDVTIWGAGNYTTNGLGSTLAELECTNCHNPHGNQNYRMLRPRPEGGAYVFDGWNGTAFQTSINRTILISSNATKYTVDYKNYTGYVPGTLPLVFIRDRDQMYKYTANSSENGTQTTYKALDDWCSQCHTRYIQANGFTNTAHTDGDPNYKFSHYTGSTGGCFMCHVAHGTSATTAGYAAGVLWPDGNATQAWQSSTNITESNTSRLLVANNRGACMQCHQPGNSN